ncbi:2564_t:CDS:2 [Paraglomus occultum]|uniref:2564_t:CDS:1 n=1 Tax=Paraglomus occultum TaxID=144539 RepID=A0A9N9AZX4_9GLOM|nr:2564_t:CDS:2 [Paraglomus occultum]
MLIKPDRRIIEMALPQIVSADDVNGLESEEDEIAESGDAQSTSNGNHFTHISPPIKLVYSHAQCMSANKLLIKQLGFEFEDNSPHLFNYASYLDELHYLAISRTMQTYFLGTMFRHIRNVEDILIQHLLKNSVQLYSLQYSICAGPVPCYFHVSHHLDLLARHTSIRILKFEYTCLSVTEANAHSNVISSIIKSQRPGLKSFKLKADYHKAGRIAEALETQIGKLETVVFVSCDFVDFGLREWMAKMAKAGVQLHVRDCRLADPSTREEPTDNFVLLEYLQM